jgi:hypothetical protein
MVENDLQKILVKFEDWYRVVIFDENINVICSKNYDVKELELK